MYNFPYTNFHDINMDWILKELKNLSEKSYAGLTIINVKDYGAQGDGFTDDSQAFVDAISAAAGNPIYVPDGVYITSIVSEITSPVTLFGSGKIVNFNYVNEHVPYNNYQNDPDWKCEYFRAYGLTFENLTIRNQVQPSIILSAKLAHCVFTGTTGLTMQNCIESSINNCDFSQVQYGAILQGCTNILFSECNFTAIKGIAVSIGEFLGNNTRAGGENIKFTGCTFIDGVTAIKAYKSHWMWINNCLIDYFNNCFFLDGGIGFKITNSYLAYEATDRSGDPDYVAPSLYTSIYARGIIADAFPTGGIIDNCDIVSYSTGTNPPLILDGLTNYLLEDVHVNNCRFRDDAGNCSQLATFDHGRDIQVIGNIFQSPDNSDMDYSFKIENSMRVYCQNNDWRKCYNGATVYPPNNYANSNQCVEYTRLTLAGDGTDKTPATSYTFEHTFLTEHPKIMLSVGEVTGSITPDNLIAYVDVQDYLTGYVRVKTLDGSNILATDTILVDMLVFGSMNI